MKLWMLLLFSLLVVSCETEKKRRTVGYKGDAKSNAFLAAQRFLQDDGRDVQLVHGVGELNEHVGMLFLPTSSVNTVGRAKRLIQWINRGGHLVLMLDGASMGGNDFVIDQRRGISLEIESDEKVESGMNYFSKQMGVAPVTWTSGGRIDSSKGSVLSIDQWEAMEEKDRALLGAELSQVVCRGKTYKIYHWSRLGVEKKATNDVSFDLFSKSDHGKYRYVSFKHQNGRLTILSDARPWRNRYIRYGDHAAFLEQLADLSPRGTIVFSYGEGDGLFDLLWKHFPLFVLGVAVFVVFWLWRHLPRFGPMKDVKNDKLRDISGAVRGVGRFLWKYRRDDVLLAAMRSQVNRALGLQPAASREGIYEQLSEKSGIPIESVIEAMTRQDVRDPGVMVRLIRNLQIIRQSLLPSSRGGIELSNHQGKKEPKKS